MGRNMLVTREGHSYVRRGGFVVDFETAVEMAMEKFINGLGLEEGSESKAQEEINDVEEDVVEEEEEGELKVKIGMAEGNGIKEGNGEINTDVSPTKSEDTVPAEVKTELRVIFWNSNSWDAQKAEKIANVAQSEGADVVCILDARIDKIRLRYIKNYEKIIGDKTGKNWRGYSALNSKAKKCRAGGTLIFVSDRCTRVKPFLTPCF